MSVKGQRTTCAPITNRADIQKLLKIPGRDGLFIAIGLYTAARLSEIRALKWVDLMEPGKRPVPRKHVVIVCKKQSKKHLVTRELPMHKDVARKAKAYFNQRGKPPLDEYVFMAKRNATPGPMSQNSLNNIVKRWFTKLNIETRNYSSHTLRKTMARMFFEKAQVKLGFADAVFSTMKMLQHKAPAQTMHYIGLDNDVVADIVDDDFYMSYLDLQAQVSSGEIDLSRMYLAAKVEHPNGPPSKWKKNMRERLKKNFDPSQITPVLNRFFAEKC
jgi:integrase